MTEPHEMIAKTYPGKTGSPFQVIAPRRRKLSVWGVVSTVVTVAVAVALLIGIPVEAGW